MRPISRSISRFEPTAGAGLESESATSTETSAETSAETEASAEGEAEGRAAQGSTSATEGTWRQRREFSRQAIPVAVKKSVLGRSQRCEFWDAKTGKVCGSKRFS
ncbi:MAG: hypothetical protein JNM39_01900 [Bdellovibrionaceae bacterium]|nr:hypothetical protein [Pseudobdellovibrionaceae bacterium]